MPLQTTTTAEDILEMAYGRLADVSPENIATEGVELLNVVNQAMAGLYVFASEISPEFFGVSEAVPYEDGGWERPQNASTVFRIELSDGSEVIVLPQNQRHMDTSSPAVYFMGQYYKPTGHAQTPLAGNLTIFYSKLPDPVTDLTQTLDPMWVESFNELLALEVAIYIALKDDQQNELAHLRAERDVWATRFATVVRNHSSNISRAWSTSRRIPSSAFSLLAGGS